MTVRGKPIHAVISLVKWRWQGKPIQVVISLSSATFAATSLTFCSLLILNAWSVCNVCQTQTPFSQTTTAALSVEQPCTYTHVRNKHHSCFLSVFTLLSLFWNEKKMWGFTFCAVVVTGWSHTSVLYGIRMCSTVFLKVKHQVLFWADWILYTPSQSSIPTILFNIITVSMSMGVAVDLYSAGSHFGSSTRQVYLTFLPSSRYTTLLNTPLWFPKCFLFTVRNLSFHSTSLNVAAGIASLNTVMIIISLGRYYPAPHVVPFCRFADRNWVCISDFCHPFQICCLSHSSDFRCSGI